MKGPKYTIGKDANEIVLATYCDACDGHGCSDCDNFGALITEDGSQILALVNDILLKGRK